MDNHIVVDTNSFAVTLDEFMVPVNIEVIDEQVADYYKKNPAKKTEGLIAELTMNLHAAKAVTDEVMVNYETLQERLEDLDEDNHKLRTECEMLRDELDQY